MSPNKPTKLANAEWHGLFSPWPNLLKKLNLVDGLDYFLDWEIQYLSSSSHGISTLVCSDQARLHARYLLDHQLLDNLMDHMEVDFEDMDFETLDVELVMERMVVR